LAQTEDRARWKTNEEVQTGGGQDPDDLGTRAGVANPGLEDLGVDEDDDEDS
jgi:hypothetical protein